MLRKKKKCSSLLRTHLYLLLFSSLNQNSSAALENHARILFAIFIGNVTDGAEHTQQVWEECLTHQRLVLPSRRTAGGSASRKGIQSAPLLRRISPKSCTHGGTNPCTSMGWGPSWKGPQQKGPGGSGAHQTEHEPECALKAEKLLGLL